MRGDLEPHSLFGVGACVTTERCEVQQGVKTGRYTSMTV